ncbi:MAG: hypothetical protein B6I24_08430 [Bacteroidetes bacterium 4572_128]|nr:MAG: hypothetical protein B6I24_08430 [Bacteroidetes bacterium 4572_128]
MKRLNLESSCRNCLYKINLPFRYLTNLESENLSCDKSILFYEKGEKIYREGSYLSGFYCVTEGIVKLYKTGINGKEQIIRFAKAGDIIAYRSVLSSEASCTSAKVIRDVKICFIPSKNLFKFIKTNGNFAIQLIKKACVELGESNDYIMNIAQNSVKKRLIEILIHLKEEFGLDEEGFINIYLTREELANIAGTATESVIRLLSSLKSKKLLYLKGKKIKILNKKKLILEFNF